MALTFLEALTEHLDAVRERDIDRFAQTLAGQGVQFIGGDGTLLEGKENVVAAHREWFMNEHWTFDPEIVSTREEAGASFALLRVTYTEQGQRKEFWLSFGFVEEDGAWKVLCDQNTPIPA
ncbi:MAG: nuclear transport factor 2 family protein [Candidatus Baltobacteraceae bacterium]